MHQSGNRFMAKTVCGHCENEIDPDANEEIFTDVGDERGTRGLDGCSNCAMSCGSCGEMFYAEDALRWHDESGSSLCRECWNNKVTW